MVEGRLALRDGDVLGARVTLRRSVVLSRVWGLPSQVAAALTSVVEAELAAGDRAAAAATLAQPRDVAGSDAIWPFVRRELEATAVRVGRRPAPAARRPGVLVEELTDRELSILRSLRHPPVVPEAPSEGIGTTEGTMRVVRSCVAEAEICSELGWS